MVIFKAGDTRNTCKNTNDDQYRPSSTHDTSHQTMLIGIDHRRLDTTYWFTYRPTSSRQSS
ncbi:hypothetical protein SCLCIDRAFT_870393 [Scleroderma citrinum Foug A]|uniref:Uncharacterized protein n=1 Tax=Scleroderma citrinum Foug A TaxID=1036808 RepID=A0A0C2ZIJ1_9AGAM|nr:hypothetical protein SCLCIDRAFT_870393 [Scleroderma citrinum Foug A]